MAPASVERKQPWAGRDDQAVTQETAKTVSQKGKAARDGGSGGVVLGVDLMGITRRPELASEGQGKRKGYFLGQKEMPPFIKKKDAQGEGGRWM